MQKIIKYYLQYFAIHGAVDLENTGRGGDACHAGTRAGSVSVS
jgi:hypothetical protein